MALTVPVQERRGAEQAAVRRDDRPGRRAAQHPGRPPPQEERGGRGQVVPVAGDLGLLVDVWVI